MDPITFGLGMLAGFVVTVPIVIFVLSLCFAAKRGDQINDELERRLAEERSSGYHG